MIIFKAILVTAILGIAAYAVGAMLGRWHRGE